MPGDDASLDQNGALAEFTALRAEILARQGHQHTMMALNLTLSGAVFSFALTQPHRLLALLLVPFIAFMIGGRYVAQDYAIEEAGAYIREHLSGRVAGGLGWESFLHRNRFQRRRRLYFGLDPLFIAFPGIAAAALAFCAPPIWEAVRTASAQGAFLLLAWFFGAALVAVSARNVWQTRRHFIKADWGRGTPKPVTPTGSGAAG